jgi:hypothetical protein
VEKIISSLNASGANQPNHPSRQERGLHLVIVNNEEKLGNLESRRIALLQELDCIGEEKAQTRVEIALLLLTDLTYHSLAMNSHPCL